MKRYLPLFFLTLIFIIFLHPFDGNGDFYHHIDTGRWILQNHSLPQVDSFTHTRLGQPWVAHSWASGVVLYLIFQHFGNFGVSLIVAGLAVLTFGLLFFVLRGFGISDKASLVTLALLIGPISTRWPQRSEIFYYPLLLLIFLINQWRIKYPKISLALPVILLLWANFYGGAVILGWGLIGLFALIQLFADKFKITKSNYLFYLATISAFPISLINGYGLNTIFYFFIYIPKVRLYEGEWAGIYQIFRYLPTSYLISVQYNLMIYFLFLLIFLGLVAIGFKNIAKHKLQLALSLAIFLPILAFRQLPVGAILSAPLIATVLQTKATKKWLLGLFLLISIGMIGLSLIGNPVGLQTKSNQPLDGLVAYINDHHLQGKSFNHIHLGGFLTYHFFPQILTFIDTRDDLFVNSQTFDDLYNISSTNQPITPLLKKYQIDLVVGDIVTDNLAYRSLFYSSDYQIVYFNDRYLLAVSKQMANQYHLNPINSVDPFSQTAAKPGMEAEAASYYQNLIASGQDTADNRFYLAESLEALNQLDQANQVLSGIDHSQTTLSPQLIADKALLQAENYLFQRNCDKASTAINQALSQSQNSLLFFLPQPQPSKTYKVQALFAFLCSRDPQKAQDYLNQYLSQTNISPLEKTKTLKEFNDLLAPQQ